MNILQVATIILVFTTTVYSQTVTLGTRNNVNFNVSECYKRHEEISSTEEFKIDMMGGEWFEQLRTHNSFEGEGCQEAICKVNGDQFIIYFSDRGNYLGLVQKSGEILATLDNEQYSYTFVINDFSNSAIIYACHKTTNKIKEHVWILSRSQGTNGLDSDVNTFLNVHPRLLKLLQANLACNSTELDPSTSEGTTSTTEIESDTSQPTTGQGSSPTNSEGTNATDSSSTCESQAGPTASPEYTNTAATSRDPQTECTEGLENTSTTPAAASSDTESSTPPGSTSTAAWRPTNIIGFHIANSNKTFYFLRQFLV